MTKVVAVATSQIDYVCKDNTIDKILVTTIAYDDGRVVQQYCEGAEWVQIKDPDTWEPVPGEGDPDEVDDPEVKTQPGKCAACEQLFKPGEVPVYNAAGKLCHQNVKECDK